MENYYEIFYELETADVGIDKKMTIAAVMRKLQTASSKHSDILEIGVDDIERKFGAKWMISKAKLQIIRYPVLGERIKIITRLSKPHFGICPRSFRMIDENGEILVKAYMEWFMYNTEKMSIIKSDEYSFSSDFKYINDLDLKPSFKVNKLKTDENDFLLTRKMYISDLDLNGHVNNISYLKAAVDCFSIEEYKTFNITNFEILFKKQAFYGDELSMFKKQTDDDNILIEGKINGEDIFKCLFSR